MSAAVPRGQLVAAFVTPSGGLCVIQDAAGVLHLVQPEVVVPPPEPAQAAFCVGQHVVIKSAGDSRIEGEVRAVFTMTSGAVRYVVEHEGVVAFSRVYPAWELVAQPQPCPNAGVGANDHCLDRSACRAPCAKGPA